MSQDATAISASPDLRVGLISIFLCFLKMGAFSFGGGLTGWVYQEVVEFKRWMKDEEFMSGLALCQVLPGANVTNLSVFIGLRLRGIVGAATALTGLLIAPFFAVIAFVVLYDQISSLIWLPPAMDGVSAAATGLLIIVGVKGGLRTIGKFAPMAALVATGFMVGILQWPLLPVVFSVAPLSIAAAWPRKRRDA